MSWPKLSVLAKSNKKLTHHQRILHVLETAVWQTKFLIFSSCKLFTRSKQSRLKHHRLKEHGVQTETTKAFQYQKCCFLSIFLIVYRNLVIEINSVQERSVNFSYGLLCASNQQSLVMLAAVGEGYSRTPFLQFFFRDSEGFPDLMLPTPSQPSLESPPNW